MAFCDLIESVVTNQNVEKENPPDDSHEIAQRTRIDGKCNKGSDDSQFQDQTMAEKSFEFLPKVKHSTYRAFLCCCSHSQ